MKQITTIITVMASWSITSFAFAQQNSLPPNVPPPGGVAIGAPMGIKMLPPPPAHHNALTASPQLNAQYGIPPAPNATTSPDAHAKWVRAVSGTNFASPNLTELTHTNIQHGPAKKAAMSVANENAANAPGGGTNGTATATSSNWSGTAIYNPSRPFQVEAVIGEFVVPKARQAFGSCSGGWDYSSQWVGIDGWGSSDVFQAGVEADAYCSGSTTAAFYSTWIEWYPYNEVRVSSPGIQPGDLVFVEVWNTSPTNGYAYIKNMSTNTAASYQLTAPPGTQLVGNSVEWVVERPGINGSLATLTNYIDVPFNYGIAWNYTSSAPTIYYPGQNPAAGTLYNITMLDNAGKPVSAAYIQNASFLWFQDYGSACGLSTNPC
jgi:hypothetical protein